MKTSHCMVLLISGALDTTIGQEPGRADVRHPVVIANERRLVSLLKWEILWDVSGSEYPRGTTTQRSVLAIQKTAKHLYFCSKGIGYCARYRTDGGRIGDRLDRRPCRIDEVRALSEFLTSHGEAPLLGHARGDREFRLDGPIHPDAFSGIAWTDMVEIPSREAITAAYAKLRPERLESLRRWARLRYVGSYRRIVASCFLPSDPYTYMYGERLDGSQVILTVGWREDEEGWAELAQLWSYQDKTTLVRMRAQIQAISCGEILFN